MRTPERVRTALTLVASDDDDAAMETAADVLASLTLAAIVDVLGDEYADADPLIRRSQDEAFGDFQSNAVMALAKRAGRNPRELAAEVVDRLDAADVCSNVEIAGPGFINFTMSADALGRFATALADDADGGVAPTSEPGHVIVDYSAPNVAKEMHVGHLRSTIIGDSLVRIAERLGHRVTRQNHIGDWGTPFGMLIEHLIDEGEDVAAETLSVGDLTGFYQQARAKFDDESDPSFADRARERVVALQAGDETSLRLWRLLYDASSRYFSSVYDRLDVLLTDDDIAAESSYNAKLDSVVDELVSKGVLVESDGALVAYADGFVNRDGDPLGLIVRKSDGGYGYQATDLEAIRHRTQDLGADLIRYVVGAPQAQHLEMIYAVAGQAGWLDHAVAEHVPFGSVLGEDGKMLKTRSGETIKLADLLDEAVVRAEALIAEKNPDIGDEERGELSHLIGIGAVKYGDLSSDRVKDYVFSWDRMLAFDGNTAPYLQYAHARIQSIFRRAGRSVDDLAGATITVTEPAEKALVLELMAFGEAVRGAHDAAAPHRICTHLFDLAQTFSRFYESCPVLKADDDATVTSRLALCALTARTLADGLDLLGIAAPDRM